MWFIQIIVSKWLPLRTQSIIFFPTLLKMLWRFITKVQKQPDHTSEIQKGEFLHEITSLVCNSHCLVALMPLLIEIGKWRVKCCCTFSWDDLVMCILWTINRRRLVLLYQYDWLICMLYSCLKEHQYPSSWGQVKVWSLWINSAPGITLAISLTEAKETPNHSPSQWTGVLPFSVKHQRRVL